MLSFKLCSSGDVLIFLDHFNAHVSNYCNSPVNLARIDTVLVPRPGFEPSTLDN